MRAQIFFASGLLLLGACAGPLDDESDSAGGKADAIGIAEDDPRAHAILRLVNESDLETLDDDVGLNKRAAKNIIKHRAGADQELDTADDDRFDSLNELDGVSFVGPSAMGKLLDFAIENGFLEHDWRLQLADASPDSSDHTLCRFEGPAAAERIRMFIRVDNQHEGAEIKIFDEAGIMRQTLSPPFAEWTRDLRGNSATFQFISASGQARSCVGSFLIGAQTKVPAIVDDPLACVVGGALSQSTPPAVPTFAKDEPPVTVASMVLPRVNGFAPLQDSSSVCFPNDEMGVRFVPPTDGRYSFRWPGENFAGPGFVGYELRRDRCEGEILTCNSGHNATWDLRAGEAVIVRFDSSVTLGARDLFKTLNAVRAAEEKSCEDGFDQDGDGLTDCDDPDCADECAGPEICDNGIDDNGDGDIDCKDEDCELARECGLNECPGLDIGSPISFQDGEGKHVAQFNNQGVTVTGVHGCNTPDWINTRSFKWTAPENGTYRMRAERISGVSISTFRVLDSCGGFQVECTQSGSELTFGAAAGEEVIFEVGTGASGLNDPSLYGLRITKAN